MLLTVKVIYHWDVDAASPEEALESVPTIHKLRLTALQFIGQNVSAQAEVFDLDTGELLLTQPVPVPNPGD